MTATVVRVTGAHGPQYLVRCLDHPLPFNADGGWSQEKAQRLALEHDVRDHPLPGTRLAPEQMAELRAINEQQPCTCYTRWDDTLGEFTGDDPCPRCRLDRLLDQLVAP